MSTQTILFAPTKLNNGRLSLMARETLEEPQSPSKFKDYPSAPRKSQPTKCARDETGDEPTSPFKPRKVCPSAPKAIRTRSFISSYEEDWENDSYIPTQIPVTWAPYHKKSQSHRH